MLHDLLSNPVTSALLGLAAIAWILYRQLVKRPVGDHGAYRPVVILGVVGVLQAFQVADRATPVVVVAWLVGLAAGAGIAVLRGRSVRLTRENGVLMRQGTVVTLLLWILAIGLHIGIDFAAGALTPAGAAHAASFGTATTLLYLAVVLAVQQAVVQQRARSARPGIA